MLPLIPRSHEDVRRIQSERKVVAVERARRALFFADKLDHIDHRRLDDPEEWRKIPIMTKDQLRALGAAEFQRQFCIAVLPRLGDEIAQRFAIKPQLVVLASGTLAKAFEASVKAPRFVDHRS